MKIPVSIAAFALLHSIQAFGANLTVSERFPKSLPVDPAGSVWINNAFGSIDVIGTDANVVEVVVDRTIVGLDEQALKEGRDSVVLGDEGDSKVRVLRTLYPQVRNPRWTASVGYTVRVPRSVNLKIASKAADHIRISNLTGTVTVSTFSGTIILTNIGGASTVETVNGRVIYDYSQRPMADVRVQAVNANIDVFAPPDAAFNWAADTIKGDFLTTFPVHGGFVGSLYRGRVNGGGGANVITSTFTGTVRLLAKGVNPMLAKSVKQQNFGPLPVVASADDLMLRPSRKIQLPIFNGDWLFVASVADIAIGEIRGDARVETGAGEVNLDVVYGTCLVKTLGGPLTLGDMMGPVNAHTGAGDVLVRILRQGGDISTDGGIIRVLYAAGQTSLRSGGGDIVVRQASGPIDAQTRSGDITITADASQKTQKFSARTSQGNIMLTVSPQFAGDIDALVITDDAAANAIHSDFNLTMRRENVNGKTRIRATGKINGGGERIDLYAEDGSINISSQVITATRPSAPRP